MTLHSGKIIITSQDFSPHQVTSYYEWQCDCNQKDRERERDQINKTQIKINNIQGYLYKTNYNINNNKIFSNVISLTFSCPVSNNLYTYLYKIETDYK